MNKTEEELVEVDLSLLVGEVGRGAGLRVLETQDTANTSNKIGKQGALPPVGPVLTFIMRRSLSRGRSSCCSSVETWSKMICSRS